MSKPTDAVATAAGAAAIDYPAPYVYRRRVRWGDSDAARIAYTVRFFDYAMEAIEGWFDDVLGSDWYISNTQHGLGLSIRSCRDGHPGAAAPARDGQCQGAGGGYRPLDHPFPGRGAQG